jgi:hypothetical protein
MPEKASLLTSKRLWIAIATALIPVLAKELFKLELTPEQIQNITTIGITLIGGYTFKDHLK